MRIVHIGPDSQFVQFISKIFEEAAPGANRYLITSASSAGSFRFPVHADAPSIPVLGIRGIVSVPLHVRSCDMIIVHGMGAHGIAAFLSSQKKTLRVWSGWGFDYYGDHSNSNSRLILPATKKLTTDADLMAEQSSQTKSFAKKMIAQAKKIAAKRADLFSAPIPLDFDVFKRSFDGFSGEYAQLNYGSVADTFAQGLAMGRGLNILVGNSASATNNHIEIFQSLARHNLASRKVIVPLSYGDPGYREKLIIHGKKILGDAFVPLVDFLPLDEYCSVVASCNVVIMNHLRQQALGNIGAALHQGAHVFLDPSNPLYQFFKEKNTVIHSVHDLELKALPLAGLLDEEIAKNRAVLEQFWGEKKIRANVEALLVRVRKK